MPKLKPFYLTLLLCLLPSLAQGFPISDTDKYAWGEETGYINFNPDNGNVDVSVTKMTGYAWSDNFGWINLAPTNSGVTVTDTYDGTACSGQLGGQAWGSGTGWINFTGGSIDDAGVFSGTILSAQVGKMSLKGTNHKITTTWRPCTLDTDGDGDPDAVEIHNGTDVSDSGEYTDTDGDGISDFRDPDGAGPGYGDSDGDGISDNVECPYGYVCPDTDGDGTPDYLDTDHDGDGVPDSEEATTDEDGDGTIDYFESLTNGEDSDGDGVPDATECSAGTGCPDADGDGVPDHLDFDPHGFFYRELDGKVVQGGSIGVSGPGLINIAKTGADGEYQFFTDGTAGVYTVVFNPPTNYDFSTVCTPAAGAFDPTGHPDDPIRLGAGQNGTSGDLTNFDCATNPYYLSFDLAPGDAFVLNNNVPLQVTDRAGVFGSGGTNRRDVVRVCDLGTDKCTTMFPTGTDTVYKDYIACSNKGGAIAEKNCADDWAVAKGFTLFEEYQLIKSKNAEVAAEESLKAAANKNSSCDLMRLMRSPERRGQGLEIGYFSDAPQGHRAYQYAVDLAEQDIIHGDNETKNLRIDDPITRAEAMKVYSRAREDSIAYQEGCLENAFPDVEWYSWYHRYVENMRVNNIVHGYDDGFYRPAKNINLAELAKVSAISFGFITKNEADAVRSQFGGEWYAPYINVLKAKRVMPDWLMSANPDRVVSRGDMFAVISKILMLRDNFEYEN